jgi:hypothetical protein
MTGLAYSVSKARKHLKINCIELPIQEETSNILNSIIKAVTSISDQECEGPRKQ